MNPQLSKLARRLRREWRGLDLPDKDKTVLIAVSGGADSSALLAAMHELAAAKKLNLRLIVAHFNHNLRGAASESDAEFVKDLAAKLNLEFAYEIQDSDSQIRDLKGNLEENARLARYDFFIRTAERFSAFAVLTAHTVNDQAETFLLRLLRGSGADGLGGMEPVRNLKPEILLVRPFLSGARREEVENYCREQKIEFREDAMNDDLRFARVRIRHELLPLLAEFNPKIITILASTSAQLREEARELNKITLSVLKEAIDAEGNIIAPNLVPLSIAIRRRLLRLWLKNQRGDLRRIDIKHLEAVEKLVYSKRGGSVIELPGKGIVVKKGRLLVYKTK